MKPNAGPSARRPLAAPDRMPLGRTPAPPVWTPAPRVIPARVLIRPARPDDLEEATLLERRVRGAGLAAPLNELQRRLFALPEAFLLAELQRTGLPATIVGMVNGVIWTRDFPRAPADYERILPSASHNPRGDVLYIASLGVDPTWRGRGIALRILQEIAAVGRRRHLKHLRIVGNSRCLPLLGRAGFQEMRPLAGLFRPYRDRMPAPSLLEMPLG